MTSLFHLAATVLLCSVSLARSRLVRVTDPRTEPIADACCMAVAPDGRIFITERKTGRVRIYDSVAGKLLAQPFAALPATNSDGERGLLGVAVGPGWPARKHVFALQHYNLSTTEVVGRLVRWDASGNVGTNQTVLMDRIPTARAHNGGYLRFGPDGKLYFPVGDQGSTTKPQDRTPPDLRGKIHRFNPDGTIPADNPFGTNNSFFCLGVRNSFGIAFHPVTGALFESENGPSTTDELQLIRPGGNYGWPIELGDQGKAGFDKPMLTWTPTIAPCGLDFYRGIRYPASDLYSLWVCDLKNTGLLRLGLAGSPADRVASSNSVQRMIRPTDVRMGVDGYLYALSHVASGGLYRVEWTGQAPVLPDLSSAGTPAIGNRIISSHRGRAGLRALLVAGPRQPATTTPFGQLEVTPVVVVDLGVIPADGVLSFLVAIPNVGKLVGRTASFQSLEYTRTLQGTLTPRMDIAVVRQ